MRLRIPGFLRYRRVAPAEQPTSADQWYQIGNKLKDAGRLAEAAESYGRALSAQPNFAAARCNRAVVLLQLNQPEEALSHLQQAIAINSKDALAHYNLALVWQKLDRTNDAMSSYDRAIELQPGYLEAHFNRAVLNEHMGNLSGALSDIDRVLQIRPHWARALLQRGNIFVQLGRWSDALLSFEGARADDLTKVTAELHRGNVLRHLGRWDEALASYDRLLILDDTGADSHYNRGVLLEQMRRIPDALESFDRAIALKPDFAAAQYNRALALLLSGEYRRGFDQYEWRWKNRENYLTAVQHHPELPLWQGETVTSKSLLVFSEQGLGDTLQFCRYVKLLADLGAEVVFEVQEPLLQLLQGLEGAALVIARGDPMPKCDFKVPLLSLPRLFKTTLETIPSALCYLPRDSSRIQEWRSRLGASDRRRVGLAWSGNPQLPNDRHRSLGLAEFAPHLPPQFEYYCLQKDVSLADQQFLAQNAWLRHLPLDFADTAALCESMDAVVSVCTSIAHLAAAVGRPTFVLLSFCADWRWLMDRSDSPWYPTVTLYRQRRLGVWDDPLTQVAADLLALPPP
jgi:tetratricopeptide (TPR) repeat protein